jgi:tRNA (uracil-5-)-methyltransferase TRM9
MASDEQPLDEDRGESYESEHVHTVYEQIASHFSSTRYKVRSFHVTEGNIETDLPHQPWPIIERFLKGLPAGAVGLDIGCGNGKYLAVNHDIFIIGTDRCVMTYFSRTCRYNCSK